MKEYDALEAAYRNGFEAGYKLKEVECGIWELNEITPADDRALYVYHCSRCDWRVFTPSNYCPYCGSRMSIN
jgi:hypothetical protein